MRNQVESRSRAHVTPLIDALIVLEFIHADPKLIASLYRLCDLLMGHRPGTSPSPTMERVHDILWGMSDEKRLQRVLGGAGGTKFNLTIAPPTR